MKKKEKDLTKKARKQIRRSLEETLTDEITKVITAQGRNPKKVSKEIKKAASQIAKKLADKESLSKPVKMEDTAADVKKRANSFDVPPMPPPQLPVVSDPPVAEIPAAKTRTRRRVAGEIAAEAEASAASPARRGRKATTKATAEAEAVPVRPVRKRTVRTPAVQVEPATADTENKNLEEDSSASSANPDKTTV